MSEAQADIRAGQTDAKLLKDLGMSASQFRDFVTRYTDRFDRLRTLAERTDRPIRLGWDTAKRAGAEDVQMGKAALGNLQGTPAVGQDDMTGLATPQRQKVARSYRRHVAAFFQAVSETAPPPATPPQD